MNVCSTVEIREKEVINLCDGTRLGYACDFEVDLCDAKLVSLILPAPCGFFGFSRGEPLVIPWCCVECVGEDAILVKLDPNTCSCRKETEKHRKWFK